MPKGITGEKDLQHGHNAAKAWTSFFFFYNGGQEIRAGFNKDDGMEESISGAGLGQVFQL